MNEQGGTAARYWSLLVIAFAIAGLLAMHGLEAIGFQSSGDHETTQASTWSSGETHSDACSPDLPHTALFTTNDRCGAPTLAPTAGSISHEAHGYGLSNRDVLKAFSVLRV